MNTNTTPFFLVYPPWFIRIFKKYLYKHEGKCFWSLPIIQMNQLDNELSRVVDPDLGSLAGPGAERAWIRNRFL